MDKKTKTMAKKSSKMDQIPLPTLRRLPYYYNILCAYEKNNFKYISSAMIAKQIGIDDTQVRKDIASTGYTGKPKVGFNTTEFKEHLQVFLGMNETKEAILIGTGNLGLALAKYGGFKQYGLKISALFDIDNNKIGNNVGNLEIYPVTFIENYLKKNNTKIAILTLLGDDAQKTCSLLVKNGIKAIWNYTSVYLNVPDDVFVWNENLAASFILLSQFISKEKQ